jgi:hypothetical protein
MRFRPTLPSANHPASALDVLGIAPNCPRSALQIDPLTLRPRLRRSPASEMLCDRFCIIDMDHESNPLCRGRELDARVPREACAGATPVRDVKRARTSASVPGGRYGRSTAVQAASSILRSHATKPNLSFEALACMPRRERGGVLGLDVVPRRSVANHIGCCRVSANQQIAGHATLGPV